MSKEGMTLADQLKAEAAQREKNCGEHPSLETLTDYALGDLDEQVAEGLRDHLAFCQRCADQYLTIDGPLDFEIDMSLTQKPDFLQPMPVPERPTSNSAAPAPQAPARPNRGRLRTWMTSAAAAACLVVGFQVGRLQPQADPPQFALRAEGEGITRELPALQLTIPTHHRRIQLYYSSFNWRDAERAEIVLVTPDKQRITVKKNHLRTPGHLIFSMPTKVFKQAGEYRFDVFENNQNGLVLQTLKLSVEKRKPSSVKQKE